MGEQIYLRKFGHNGQLIPLPEDTLYFDFSAAKGVKWTNSLGEMRVLSAKETVEAAGAKYPNSIRIRQKSKGGELVFTFAPGVGFFELFLLYYCEPSVTKVYFIHKL